MKKYNILYRQLAILGFTILLSSCLKETTVPIESVFIIETSEDKTSPVTIHLRNGSYGVHRGRFASPKRFDGTMFPFQNRALKGNEKDYAEFYDLVILEDLPVEIGAVVPWFNQPGKGVQVIFLKDIEDLIKEGKIEIRNLEKIK